MEPLGRETGLATPPDDEAPPAPFIIDKSVFEQSGWVINRDDITVRLDVIIVITLKLHELKWRIKQTCHKAKLCFMYSIYIIQCLLTRLIWGGDYFAMQMFFIISPLLY